LRHVTDIFTATEAQISDAMKLTWTRMTIVMGPSCAVPLAAITANPQVFKGRRIGVIITGGNVDFDRLPWIKERTP
jgi:threonine dehydratase